jgi:hypothetical protein
MECCASSAAMIAAKRIQEGPFMHLHDEHILEMAQEGAKLTPEEREHLRDCAECGELFRTLVLQHVYKQRPDNRPVKVSV